MSDKAVRNLVKEAVDDASAVKELAIEAAKQKLVEELSPSIRSLVEKRLNSASEDVDRLRRAADGYGETEFEEGKSKGDDKMAYEEKKDDMEESLEGFFPGISEMGDYEDDEMKEDAGLEEMGDFGDAEGDMDEDVEISETELKKAYESIMKANKAINETSVDWKPSTTSGFGDSYKDSDWETEDPKPKLDGKGLHDEESGEKPWEEVPPSNAQDYQVKEAIEKGLKENATLRKYVSYLEENLEKAVRLIGTLKKEVKDVNIFNCKVMAVNEIMGKHGSLMTREQKKLALEHLDKAKSVREVKMISDTIKATLNNKNEGVSRRLKPNAQRPRTSGGVNQRVLGESKGARGSDPEYDRMRQLAGLLK